MPEPALEHFQKDKAFQENLSKMLSQGLKEGVKANDANGNPDHKTRQEYLKLVIDIACLSARDRNTMRRTLNDAHIASMQHKLEMSKVERGGNGAAFSLSTSAVRELRGS